jgi:tRNA-specific 2-thiouridylase
VAGETPIPCVSCNQTVKFADLLETAKELGADALATGHYIRSKAPTGPRQWPPRRSIARPMPIATRAISCLRPRRSRSTICAFRSAGMPKAETRALAEEMGLVVAKKADSQDICFVPQGKYADIINKLKPSARRWPGDIVHLDGRVLGRHDGILHYTIGQRRGIGVATGEPLYVVFLDARSRRVIVGPKEALETHRVYLRDVNWLGDEDIEQAASGEGFACFAKVRSTRTPTPAVLYADQTGIYVDLAVGEAGRCAGPGLCALFGAGRQCAGLWRWFHRALGTRTGGGSLAEGVADQVPWRLEQSFGFLAWSFSKLRLTLTGKAVL